MRQEANKKKYLGHNSGVYSAVLFFVCVVLLVLMIGGLYGLWPYLWARTRSISKKQRLREMKRSHDINMFD